MGCFVCSEPGFYDQPKVANGCSELLVEIFGEQGLGWSGDQFKQDELDTTRAFLSNKAMTIFSGTTEIQNNIISKRMLGLMDHQ